MEDIKKQPSTIHRRIRDLRKEILKISQKDFGNKIGIMKSSVSGYESGRRIPNESVIKSICREFNVNIAWLKEESGEIFNSYSDIDSLIKSSNITEDDYTVIEKYLSLTSDERLAINKFLFSFENKKSEN